MTYSSMNQCLLLPAIFTGLAMINALTIWHEGERWVLELITEQFLYALMNKYCNIRMDTITG